MLIILKLVLALSVPDSVLSPDGSSITIIGEGEVTPEISTQNGDKTKIQYVAIQNAASLADGSFRGFSSLINIQLPNHMDYIGASCFSECSNLRSIVIPEGILQIFSQTFFYCFKLENITLPSSLKRIDMYSTFCSTYSLKKYFINKNNNYFVTDESNSYLMSYNMTVLYKGPGSSIIHIPPTVKLILSLFSYGCNTKSVNFEGSNVEIIQEQAFEQETIEKFEPPNTLLRLESNFLTGTVNVLSIPDSVTYLSLSAFSKLKIGELKFSKNSKVLVEVSGLVYDINQTIIHYVNPKATRINANTTVQYINPSQVRLPNIEWVEVTDGNKNYSSFNGILYNPDQTILIACPGKLNEVVLSPKCKIIDSQGFVGCSLSSLTLNEGLESISFNAFGLCYNLGKVKIPSTLKTIDSWSFYGCQNLEFENSFPECFNLLGDSVFGLGLNGCINFSLCSLLKKLMLTHFLIQKYRK